MHNIAGKTPWLTLHVSDPLQSETPLALLRRSRVTDKAHLYIRNNQDLDGYMTLAEAPTEWSFTVQDGASSVQLSLPDLRRYPVTETEMVLQCSGNSRGHFGGSSPVSGAQWSDGAVANVVFGGVRLKTVLDDLGFYGEARYLLARGAGTAHDNHGPFERSVPLDDVLENALLASTLNGEPLPALHGGPLRLVLPGFYGVNNVKWLNYLSLEDEESPSHYQQERYRLPKKPLEPGQPFIGTPQNSTPSWRMKLRSLLWTPLIGDTLHAGPNELGGVAWTDGQSRVARVAVSQDSGETWHDAKLDTPESPYAWSEWSLTLELPAGEPEVWLRAFDDAGYAQPLGPTTGWNPAGYEWGNVQRVRLAVR